MAEELMSADRLKQRLIGAVALLLLGAIAWFWLLSADSPVDPVDKTTQIPPAPDIKPFTVPEPAAPAGIEPVGSERDAAPAVTVATPAPAPTPAPVAAPAPATSKPVAVAPPTPTATKAPPAETFQLDEKGLPVAWVVQVGSFAAQPNADKVKKALQDKGFKAYTQTVKAGSGSAIKVYVGPKLSRERADAQKHAIDQALKMNTMVVRFPVN